MLYYKATLLKILPIILLVMTLQACRDQQSKETEVIWERFQSESGRFSAQFPNGKVIRSRATARFGIADSIISHYFMYESDSADRYLLSVSYTDYPDGLLHSDSADAVSLFLGQVTQNAVQGAEGVLVAEENLPYGNFPGKQVEMMFNNDSSYMKMRVYLVGKRLYTVQVATDKEKKANPFIQKFLQSFVIKEN